MEGRGYPNHQHYLVTEGGKFVEINGSDRYRWAFGPSTRQTHYQHLA